MSKYKLLQRYPSLPKSWKVGEIVKQSYSPHCYSSISSDINYRINIPKEEVENNPDFWEEIISKKYEVLSIKDKTYSNKILKVKNYIVGEGAFLESTCRTEDFNSNRDSYEYITLNYNIHSIKRTSDGEIFTVGDRVTIEDFHKATIKSFKISDVFELLVYATSKSDKYSFNQRIERVRKYEEPLFTTEDGVEIFERDKYYHVSQSFRVYEVVACEEDIKPPINRAFSTEEKAEEWVNLNKPKYSKKDVMSIIDKSLSVDKSVMCESLESWKEYVINLNKVKEQLNE